VPTFTFCKGVNLDPVVYLLTDFTNSTTHLNVSVSATSEETYFSSSQFEQVAGQLVSWLLPCPWDNGDCDPQSIAVGPNANGSAVGDPWVLGNASNSFGDHYVFHWENSQWVEINAAGTQIAVSPQGVPWAINHTGQIYYYNGSSFVLNPGGGCAISIGVGPASPADPYGTPWVIGCNGSGTANGDIYYLNGSTWVQEPGAATHIAVSPEGLPWVINASGSIYHWGGSNWVQVPGCATSIAVGPTTAPLAGPYGDTWVTGCAEVNSYGYYIYQLQHGTTWVNIPGPPASQISVSPDRGVPWITNFSGQIYE
jgi:hypothetical protein